MKPFIVLAGLGALAAAATPAAAQCGCATVHRTHYVHHRYARDYPPVRTAYRPPVYAAPVYGESFYRAPVYAAPIPRPVYYGPAYPPPPVYGWGPRLGYGYGWGGPRWGYGYGWGHPWGRGRRW